MKILLSFIFLYSIAFSNEIKVLNLKESFDIKGMTINKKNKNTLYLINNKGNVLKYNLDNNTFSKINILNKNFQAIDFNPSATFMFLVEEGKDNVFLIRNKEPYSKISEFKLSRKFENNIVLEEKNEGLESLSFINEDDKFYYFYSANKSNYYYGKDKSSIIKIALNKITLTASIINLFEIPFKNISDLQYISNNEIYFISDKEKILIKTNSSFNEFEISSIPGKMIEAIYINKETKELYLGEKNKIYIIKGLIK